MILDKKTCEVFYATVAHLVFNDHWSHYIDGGQGPDLHLERAIEACTTLAGVLGDSLTQIVNLHVNWPFPTQPPITPIFHNSLQSMFANGTNRGKIWVMLAYTVELCAWCVQNGHEQECSVICKCAAIFAHEKLLEWIQIRGGWETILNL